MLSSLDISPLGASLVARKGLCLIMLSIFSSIVLIAASAIPPCLIATIEVSSNFGVLGERLYIKRI